VPQDAEQRGHEVHTVRRGDDDPLFRTHLVSRQQVRDLRRALRNLRVRERPRIRADGDPIAAPFGDSSVDQVRREVQTSRYRHARPELVEGRAERLRFHRYILSETLILRQAQDERRVEGLTTSGFGTRTLTALD